MKKLLLLIRPKKGVETQSRLTALLKSKVFDRWSTIIRIISYYFYCRVREGSLLDKVEAVNGDIVEPHFGLDAESLEMIINEVNIIFHSAATVRFDEDLTKSVAMNVEAVSSMIWLARQVKNLESIVDVSTAYSNCDLKHIEEKVYPAPVNPKGIMDLCKVGRG